MIKSDSAYLVNSMTNSIEKWKNNGWQTAKKTPVKNRDLWEEMIERVLELEDLDTPVDFWHVPREMNKEADELANDGLSSGAWLGRHGLLHIEQESDFIGGGL